MQVITIETDAAGADRLTEAAGQLPGATYDARQVQAQVGDPDTWMFVAQLAPTVLATFSATVLTLLRQRKIKYIKVGGAEFRDVTPQQLTEVMKILEAPRQ